MEMATLESIIVKLHKIIPIILKNLTKTKKKKKGVKYVAFAWNMSSLNHKHWIIF
jgi:hypothetical protein